MVTPGQPTDACGPPGVSAPVPGRRLRRCQRITESKDFRLALDRGLRLAGRYMVMVVHPGPPSLARLGVIASRRTFRHAHERNRARRLLREAFRLNRSRLLTPGPDIVLLARRAILNVKRQPVERELVSLAGELGLLGRSA